MENSTAQSKRRNEENVTSDYLLGIYFYKEFIYGSFDRWLYFGRLTTTEQEVNYTNRIQE